MTPPISHIFDQSSCLSMRQLKEYVAGTQTHEERHATEHHLNDCSLCSEAVQGLYAKKGAADNLSSTINSNFLKQHINTVHPQDHAPASHPVKPVPRRQKFTRAEGTNPVAFAPLVSALFILCGYLLWQKPQVPTPKARQNSAHVIIPASGRERVPEAVVIPVRHNKDEKPKVVEPEVVHIPPAAKAQVEAMPRPEIATVRMEERIQVPKPISLRPAIVEQPKKNVMTVVAGDGVADAARPAVPDVRAAKKPEVQAFKADGHAAMKPVELPIANKPEVKASKPEVQALNKPEPHKAELPVITRSDAQALNAPKAQTAPVKQPEVQVQVQEEGRPKGISQFDDKEAALSTARDLHKQGKEEEARQILNDLAESSGSQKRAAKKMLRKMNNGTE